SALTVISHTRRRNLATRQEGPNLSFVPAYAPNPRLFPLAAWWPAIRLPRSLWPHLVSTQSPFEDALLGWLLARWFGARLEVQTHFGILSPHWVKEHPWINRLRILLARALYRRADSIRVPSSWLKREISGQLKIHAEKIRVVIIPSSLAGGGEDEA